MRLLKLFVPILLSIILIFLDARFSYLDNFKRFTLTLLSPIYIVVDLPSQVIEWINDKGSENEILVSENDFLEGQLIELKVKLQTYNNLALENQKLSGLLESSYLIPEHDVKLARVKSISQSRLSKKIIINKGFNDGVTLADLIVGSDGVVGQVTEVTPLYATGIGTFYPPGYSVGRVKSIDETLDASFLTIYLEPTQNMNKLELVLVVKEKND